MADLHPIVIPPMEHTYKSIKFTCSGEGLYKDGYLYDTHAEKLIPPKTTKAGAEVKELEKKPVAYWKAQCAFRGLNQTGAIADLQLRLREAKKKILPELKRAESELNKEFKKKNKVARNDSWSSLKTIEQKAKANPRKYLAEEFPKGATGRPVNLDIVVLKVGVDEREAISIAAESMGLESASVDALWTSSKKPSPDRWIIVGRTRDAVWNQMREIEREAGRSRQEFAKDKTKSHPSKQAISKPSAPKEKTKPTPTPKVKQEPKPPSSTKAVPRARSPLKMGSVPKPVRTKQTAIKSVFPERAQQPGDVKANTTYVKDESSTSAKSTEKSWDVRGTYRISCPYIEEQWEPQGGDPLLTLDLYLQTVNGKQQLYGIFNFRVVEGIMRFEKPVLVSKNAESSKKRKREDVDDDGHIDMNDIPEYDGESSDREEHYSKHIFYLGTKDKPTARRPTWRYRWRGMETGEGEIQLESDREVQSITFSEKGNGLKFAPGHMIATWTQNQSGMIAVKKRTDMQVGRDGEVEDGDYEL